MVKILKYIKKSWIIIFVIIGLFFIQAYCDLTLPQYTSKIVDTGISKRGIDQVYPEQMTKESFTNILAFLGEEDEKVLLSAYKEKGNIYLLKEKEQESLDKLSSVLENPVAYLGLVTMDVSEGGSEEYDSSFFDIEKIMEISGKMNHPDTNNEERSVLLGEFFDSFGDLSDSIKETMSVTFIQKEYEKTGIDMDDYQIQYLLNTGGSMILLCIISMAVSIAAGFFAARVAAGTGMTLRSRIFQKVVSFSSKEMDQFSTASLITRSTNDIQQIQMAMVMLLRIALYAPIMGIGGVLKVVNTTYSMAWIIFVALAAVLCLVTILFTVAMPKFRVMQILIDKVNLVAREILTGLMVIRAFSTEKHEEKRFDQANYKLMKVQLFTNRAMTFMMPIMMLIMNGISVMIIWFGSNSIDEGNLKVGEMMAFMTYTIQIIMSFVMLTMISIIIPRASVAAKRINEVLDTKNSVEDKGTDINTNGKGYVEFRNVTFCYPNAEEDVLSNISFEAKPGETTAFIGSTGSGKSTLINLIPRFYDVTKGEIRIDGVDIRNMPQSHLRDKLGYVPQRGILFSGTIDSNIRFGNEDASLEEIERAAQIAQAKDFILEKEEGFNSSIAQGGTNVSGGQKQRISIARAIAKNPQIYIFDDSFSALDFKTDHTLRKALKKATAESTVLIVAQRISTIIGAEQIIVLEDGKIVGKGTHSQLLRECDVYKQIASSQLSEEEIQSSIVEGKEDSHE